MLSLWKEVKAVAESLSLEQQERRFETKDGTDGLSARISQLDAEFVQKLSMERDARMAADDKFADKLEMTNREVRDVEKEVRAAGEREAKDRLEGLDGLRTAVAAQVRDSSADINYWKSDPLNRLIGGFLGKLRDVARTPDELPTHTKGLTFAKECSPLEKVVRLRF